MVILKLITQFLNILEGDLEDETILMAYIPNNNRYRGILSPIFMG